MKIFIDIANLDQIQSCLQLGIFDGVTTNPTLLLQEGVSRDNQIQSILDIGVSQLFVQLVGDTAEALVADFNCLEENLNSEKKLAYKISINAEGLLAIKQIRKGNPDAVILGTAIYSAEQAMVAGLAGCDYVAPYVNRMLNNSIQPFQVIEQVKNFYRNQGLSCKIMGASFKNTAQVIQAYESGATTVTIPPSIIWDMVERTVANDAIAIFNEHAAKLSK